MAQPLSHHVLAANVRAELARRRLRGADLRREFDPPLSKDAMSRRLTGDVPFTALEVYRLAQILAVPMESLFRA